MEAGALTSAQSCGVVFGVSCWAILVGSDLPGPEFQVSGEVALCHEKDTPPHMAVGQKWGHPKIGYTPPKWKHGRNETCGPCWFIG